MLDGAGENDLEYEDEVMILSLDKGLEISFFRKGNENVGEVINESSTQDSTGGDKNDTRAEFPRAGGS